MRVILAGTGSAVGKTTISTGIMKALSKRFNVQPFKVGPDYIDPTYHTLATGNPSRNLDSFFMSPGQIRDSYSKATKNSDISIIEGVRGLYEGMDAIEDVGSTASIAKALETPIILIINTRSLVRSAAAIVLGFKALDPKLNIQGVILNKVKNNANYLKTKKSIEELTKTPVLGGIKRDETITIMERHLGLVPAIEKQNSQQYIQHWANIVEQNIDLDQLIEIAKTAPPIQDEKTPIWTQTTKKPTKIAIAHDEVFNFYYQENLEALEANKAKIQYFSPLKDTNLPDADAIYIGGGYPELFTKELSQNKTMIQDIQKFHKENHPIFAECGGLLYLMNTIGSDKMTSIFPYHSELTEHVQALKYTITEVQEDNIISNKGTKWHGHEFHYTQVILPQNNRQKFAFKITRGTGSHKQQDGFMKGNTLASYVHTHIAALPEMASNLTRNAYEL